MTNQIVGFMAFLSLDSLRASNINLCSADNPWEHMPTLRRTTPFLFLSRKYPFKHLFWFANIHVTYKYIKIKVHKEVTLSRVFLGRRVATLDKGSGSGIIFQLDCHICLAHKTLYLAWIWKWNFIKKSCFSWVSLFSSFLEIIL